ncbi:hypothetical protein SPB21_07780 [Leptothoe sp. ISB3NOV94-8A]
MRDERSEALELARWQAMLGNATSNQVVTAKVIKDVRLGAKMAWQVQHGFQGVNGPWFDKYDDVKNKVAWNSNEGWYATVENRVVVKTLDTGHRLSDMYESLRIKLGKLINEYEDQSINYDAPWEYVRILPAGSCGLDTSKNKGRLVGAHGGFLYPGTYMFVICIDGNIRYFPNDDKNYEHGQGTKPYLQYLPHAALSKHQPVLAAGNFCVDVNGRIVWVTSNSGHYRVDDNMCRDNFIAALKVIGYKYTAKEYKKTMKKEEMKILQSLENGNSLSNELVYLHYPVNLAFQDYMKKLKETSPPLKGVRGPRTLLITTIKSAANYMSEQISISKKTILPL